MEGEYLQIKMQKLYRVFNVIKFINSFLKGKEYTWTPPLSKVAALHFLAVEMLFQLITTSLLTMNIQHKQIPGLSYFVIFLKTTHFVHSCRQLVLKLEYFAFCMKFFATKLAKLASIRISDSQVLLQKSSCLFLAVLKKSMENYGSHLSNSLAQNNIFFFTCRPSNFS